MNGQSDPGAGAGWGRRLPAFRWLRSYEGSWLRGDVVAGVALAAYLLSARIADASPNTAALLLGLAAVAVLRMGKFDLKKVPVALFAVIGGIGTAAFTGLDARGVKLLGHVPPGLPAIGLPALRWSDLSDLLPLALAGLAEELTAAGMPLQTVGTRSGVRGRLRTQIHA